jgi:hypothetical protein
MHRACTEQTLADVLNIVHLRCHATLFLQEEYIKEEQKNLKRELLRAQEEVKRIQSVPLVIGQFLEMVNATSGIVGSTTGQTRPMQQLIWMSCIAGAIRQQAVSAAGPASAHCLPTRGGSRGGHINPYTCSRASAHPAVAVHQSTHGIRRRCCLCMHCWSRTRTMCRHPITV